MGGTGSLEGVEFLKLRVEGSTRVGLFENFDQIESCFAPKRQPLVPYR